MRAEILSYPNEDILNLIADSSEEIIQVFKMFEKTTGIKTMHLSAINSKKGTVLLVFKTKKKDKYNFISKTRRFK